MYDELKLVLRAELVRNVYWRGRVWGEQEEAEWSVYTAIVFVDDIYRH